jgi:MSHA pilin protein MshC
MGVHTISRRTAGFTLIELITVLILIGIILTATIPRFAATQDYAARGYLEETLAAVRYAQKFAVASGCDVEVNINSAGYSLKQRSGLSGPGCDSLLGFATDVRDPSLADKTGSGAHAFADNTPAGVGVTGGPISFYYDKAGRPRNPLLGTALASASTITISSGALSWTLIIEPETGYVHL